MRMNQQFHSGNNGYDPIDPRLFTPPPRGGSNLPLVFGILGVLFGSLLGIAFSVTAIVLALSDRRKYGVLTRVSRAALILGIVGTVFGIASLVYNIIYLVNGGLAEILQTLEASMN